MSFRDRRQVRVPVGSKGLRFVAELLEIPLHHNTVLEYHEVERSRD